MKPHEIIIRQDGSVTGMYDDSLLPIYGSIGPFIVQRASHVEWDPTTSKWAVACAHNKDTGQRFETREAALDFERAHFWDLVWCRHATAQ